MEVINDDEFLKDRQRCENAIFTDIKQTKWTDTINGQRRETDTSDKWKSDVGEIRRKNNKDTEGTQKDARVIFPRER